VQTVDFTAAHVGQAEQIALQNYDEERRFIPALPLTSAASGKLVVSSCFIIGHSSYATDTL